MSRHRRRTGPVFWIGTFIIGLFSAERGQRGINAEMKEMQRAIDTLTYDKSRLLSELAEVTVELALRDIQAAGEHETPTGAHEETPAKSDNEATMAIPVYTAPETEAESDNSELTNCEDAAVPVS